MVNRYILVVVNRNSQPAVEPRNIVARGTRRFIRRERLHRLLSRAHADMPSCFVFKTYCTCEPPSENRGPVHDHHQKTEDQL